MANCALMEACFRLATLTAYLSVPPAIGRNAIIVVDSSGGMTKTYLKITDWDRSAINVE